MQTIWKFPLPVNDRVEVSMPRGARILHTAVQNGVVCVWAIVDPNNQREQRCFFIKGTGHSAHELEETPHVGTVFLGPLVFHVFDGGAA